MRIEKHRSRWGDALHLGPYIEWQDWNIWHHTFDIGLYIGPWIFYLSVTLWDIHQEILMLKDRGMTEEEAWDFCDEARKALPDPYHGNMKKEIKKALAAAS